MNSTPRAETMDAIEAVLHDIFGNHLRPQAPPSREMNVTMGQIHCLGTIGRLGHPTMSELASTLGLHPSTVTVLVDGLVAHGLASRKADARDRRVVRVAETPKGRKNHERHMEMMRARMAKVLAGLSDEDLDGILSSLSKLREAAREYAEMERQGVPDKGKGSTPKA